MESACLRIKFAPLIQDSLKSEYCLEIVPQVSCIKNLDKLIWKQETNFIEYKIPMTYTISLKKINQKNKDTVLKTYYSCVDLMPSSSMHIFEKATNPISRILSETFILNQLTYYMSKGDDVTRSPLSLKEVESKLIQNPNTEEKVVDIVELEQKIVNVNVDAMEKNQCDKLINTETSGLISINIKPKLSLSPICSVNTRDNNAAVTKGVTCNITVYRTPDSLKELLPITSVSSFASDAQISEKTSTPNSFQSVYFTASTRPPPEIRIAEIMHYITKELYPINLSLNQLMSKCALLGLSAVPRNNLRPAKNKICLCKPNVLCKSVKTCKTRVSKNIVSNRAVYTVVYDG